MFSTHSWSVDRLQFVVGKYFNKNYSTRDRLSFMAVGKCYYSTRTVVGGLLFPRDSCVGHMSGGCHCTWCPYWLCADLLGHYLGQKRKKYLYQTMR